MKIKKTKHGCPDCAWFNEPEGCNVERDSPVCILNKRPRENRVTKQHRPPQERNGMNIERWVCNKCGTPCKVEIHFDSKGPAGDVQRFRKRCIAGTKDIPEDHSPEWRRLENRVAKVTAANIRVGKPAATGPHCILCGGAVPHKQQP